MTHGVERHIGWAYAAVALSVVSWAAAFPVITFSLTELQPVPLATVRFGIAAIAALGWLLWTRPALPTWPHMLRFAVCGLLGFTLYSVFINIGQTTVSASAASFITNIIPILTALLAWLLLGERFRLLGWAGCLISFAGVSYIALGQPGGLSFGAGATFILVASMCSALYFVLQKPLVPFYGALPCTEDACQGILFSHRVNGNGGLRPLPFAMLVLDHRIHIFLILAGIAAKVCINAARAGINRDREIWLTLTVLVLPKRANVDMAAFRAAAEEAKLWGIGLSLTTASPVRSKSKVTVATFPMSLSPLKRI